MALVHPSPHRVARFAFLLLATLVGRSAAPAADAPPIGIAGLGRLDTLPRYRTATAIGMVSSYDRTGGNDDGFSGTYSFVRKEGDALVIADLTGPGVIYRIWTPTPTDDLVEFYFDGEPTPRLKLPFRQLFTGDHAPFLRPLADHGSGGNWSYVPLPYAKSCKVLIRAAKVQFYQINFATYPADAGITTFSVNGPDVAAEASSAAGKVLAAAGTDLSEAVAPAGAPLHRRRDKYSLAPGETVRVFEANTGGRVVGLRVSPASALAGADRAITLLMTWDGASAPSVQCPAGDFFGFAWGQPSMRSLLAGTAGDECYSYFPMPYDRAANIELRSDRAGGAAVEVTVEVIHAEVPRREDEGRFHAIWRRENPTAAGHSFTFATAIGRGHLVGVTLQAQGENNGSTGFFEGDDRAVIDGVETHHGTGSEDFFNGGWYDVPGRWETRASYPLSGCLGYVRPLSRSGAYRLFLTDAYAFQRSLVLDIEHGPTGNTDPGDYVGVSYLYLDRALADNRALPPLAQRAAQDPGRIIYKPGWYQPAIQYSIENAIVTKRTEKIDGGEVRYLSFRAAGPELFGPHHLAFFCDLPAAARYRVLAETLVGPEQGTAQLMGNDHPIGEARSSHAAHRGKSGLQAFGELDLQAGTNRLFFRLTGAGPAPDRFGFDLETLVLEKLP